MNKPQARVVGVESSVLKTTTAKDDTTKTSLMPIAKAIGFSAV